MTNHSPTPWRIAADMRGIGNTPVHGIETADGKPVANCGDWKDAQANARRILACVNACAGIETSGLQQHALGVIGAEHSQELANLKKQRDELLEVLKYCRQKIAYMHATGEWYAPETAIEKADSAIANAEGGNNAN